MTFETPNEALLKAENARLKAENAYLKNAMNIYSDMRFTPVAAVEEIRMNELPDRITLPVIAEFKGALFFGRNYHVVGRLHREHAEHLEIKYYADAGVMKTQADYAVNELFTDLHQRFISAVANSIRKE